MPKILSQIKNVHRKYILAKGILSQSLVKVEFLETKIVHYSSCNDILIFCTYFIMIGKLINVRHFLPPSHNQELTNLV